MWPTNKIRNVVIKSPQEIAHEEKSFSSVFGLIASKVKLFTKEMRTSLINSEDIGEKKCVLMKHTMSLTSSATAFRALLLMLGETTFGGSSTSSRKFEGGRYSIPHSAARKHHSLVFNAQKHIKSKDLNLRINYIFL